MTFCAWNKALSCLCLLLLLGSPALADPGERLRARIAQRPPRDLGQTCTLAGRKVAVWRPAESVAPLVLFSHGFHGNCRQSTFLCGALAKAGYLVVAPNHRDASSRSRPEVGLGQPSRWSENTFRDRGIDLAEVLATLRTDPEWAARVDWSRGVALVGHSLGGYTALATAGAWPSWKPREGKIVAVLALSPYANPFNVNGDLSHLGLPVMYQSGTLDAGVKPFLLRQGGTWEKTGSPACYVELGRAAHLAWTDINPEFQQTILHYSLAFLDRYVKGKKTDLKTRLPQVTDLRVK